MLPNEPTEGQPRLCLPLSLQEQALFWVHAPAGSGHLGVTATQKRVRCRFFFPDSYGKTETFVLGCHKCLQKRSPPKKIDRGLHIQKGYPGARWSIDLVGPLPSTEEEYIYILTAEDQFTRWPIAIPIKDKTAETIANELDAHVIAEHGVMEELLTDNAHELTGYVIRDVAKILHIKK